MLRWPQGINATSRGASQHTTHSLPAAVGGAGAEGAEGTCTCALAAAATGPGSSTWAAARPEGPAGTGPSSPGGSGGAEGVSAAGAAAGSPGALALGPGAAAPAAAAAAAGAETRAAAMPGGRGSGPETSHPMASRSRLVIAGWLASRARSSGELPFLSLKTREARLQGLSDHFVSCVSVRAERKCALC